jgi:hypothetical protein
MKLGTWLLNINHDSPLWMERIYIIAKGERNMFGEQLYEIVEFGDGWNRYNLSRSLGRLKEWKKWEPSETDLQGAVKTLFGESY